MRVIRTDGARVACERSGAGPAVLLIQGAGVIGEGWRPQVDGLDDRFDLVRIDNRGIGGSTLDGGALTIEAMAADALAVMDAEGIERCHVAGHSMGGLIAQEVAFRAPDRVRSLALLCTFARGAQAAALSFPIFVTALRMYVGTRAMRRTAFLELVLPQSFLAGADRTGLADRLRPIFGHDLADQPRIALRQVRAMARYRSLPPARLAGVRPDACPERRIRSARASGVRPGAGSRHSRSDLQGNSRRGTRRDDPVCRRCECRARGTLGGGTRLKRPPEVAAYNPQPEYGFVCLRTDGNPANPDDFAPSR